MKFSYDKAEQYCNDLAGINQNILDLLENMKSEVSKISNLGVWQGRDADYFLGRFRNLSDNIVKFSNQIDKSGKYVNTCSEKYRNLEEAIQEEISNSEGSE